MKGSLTAGHSRIALALCGGLMMAGTQTASAAETARGDIQGTVGWLYVDGAMRETACWLSMPSRRQTVTLPTVGANQLLKPGDSAEPTAFVIRLEGCMRSAGAVTNRQNNTLAWSSQQPIATVTFSGPADPQQPALFQVNGVEGIGLRLRDDSGQPLRPGVTGEPLFLTPGDNSLAFSVAPERTANRLMAGAYNATLDFKINYQ